MRIIEMYEPDEDLKKKGNINEKKKQIKSCFLLRQENVHLKPSNFN